MTKALLSLCLFMAASITFAQTPCENGMAGAYPCNNYDLMSQIPLATLAPTATLANDSWGWTDPDTSIEYALVGLSNGTAFIDISDPINPVHVATLPSQTGESSWRDIKVFNNHAFIVSEARGHGMQIFDLTRLRNVSVTPQTMLADAVNTSFGSAHNIVINEDTGYAYPVGARNLLGTSRLFSGGPIFINVNGVASGVSPAGVNEGGYDATVDNAADGYSHDAQIVTYNGPDIEHRGKEILIGSNQSVITIVDITDKANPILLSTISYSNVGYTHQGWFTNDQRYFLLGDELDESRIGFPTRTIIFDFEDLDVPKLHFEYSGPTNAIDHNGYVVGDKFYLANYNAGIRVIDISNIASANITEIGFFDSHPEGDQAGFNGAWNVYPFFKSGNILISDIDRGFLLVRQSENVLSTPDEMPSIPLIAPNPTNGIIKIAYDKPLESVQIYNMLGKEVMTLKNPGSLIDLNKLAAGIYILKINDDFSQKIVRN